MKNSIVKYLKKELPKRKLSAYYLPDGDTYVVHRKGRAVMNMNTASFYQIPKLARNRMWNALVRVGMTHNLGEKYKDQIIINHKLGIRIV